MTVLLIVCTGLIVYCQYVRCVWEESSVIDVCSYVSCCVLVGVEYLES